MSWFVTNLVASFLLPPLSLLLLLALGIFLLYRRHKLAKPLIFAAFGLLWVASTPYFAEGALHMLEAQTGPLDGSRPNVQRQAADAIVILGGGTYFHAPEYSGQDTVSEQTLLRLRYGAKLQRETGKPILVTGGKPLGNSVSEAQQMRAALEQDFRVPVRWIEDASDNTFENARYSFQIMQKASIKRIYLVTHAWHMRRAARAFESVGIKVTPAPTGFHTLGRAARMSGAYLPSAQGMHYTSLALHERLGLIGHDFKESDMPANGKPSAEAATAPSSAPAAASSPTPKKK